MANLRAGAARSCITPQLGAHLAGSVNDRIADDIHDDLYAKALVLDNGHASIAIVVCDLIALMKEDIEVAKQRAEALTGIPAANIVISCTHTHSGPATEGALGTPPDEAYMETAMERVADSVKLAQNRLRPAEVGVAATTCPGETFNRRWRMKDGTVRDNFAVGHLNPDAVSPAGPTDPEVLVLAVREREGKAIALLTNYSVHYVGVGNPTTISADYFGYFDRALQRMAGYNLLGIMSKGCCGNINNVDISRPRPESPYSMYQAERVANVLAAAAFGAWQGLRGYQYDAAPELGATTEMVTFRRRQPTPEQLARATAVLAGVAGSEEGPRLAPLEFPQAEELYAREIQMVNEEPLERVTPVMALRVGNLGIATLPGEMFVEYCLQIKEKSPFDHTMTIELANDCVGYCPTDQALVEGSYETHLARSAKAAPGTEGTMVMAALAALKRLATSS